MTLSIVVECSGQGAAEFGDIGNRPVRGDKTDVKNRFDGVKYILDRASGRHLNLRGYQILRLKFRVFKFDPVADEAGRITVFVPDRHGETVFFRFIDHRGHGVEPFLRQIRRPQTDASMQIYLLVAGGSERGGLPPQFGLFQQTIQEILSGNVGDATHCYCPKFCEEHL